MMRWKTYGTSGGGEPPQETSQSNVATCHWQGLREKFYQGYDEPIPGPLASGDLVETCIACWYSNQNVDETVTIPRFTNKQWLPGPYPRGECHPKVFCVPPYVLFPSNLKTWLRAWWQLAHTIWIRCKDWRWVMIRETDFLLKCFDWFRACFSYGLMLLE